MMPTWTPTLPDGAEPLYVRLCAAIAVDIDAGHLAPGDRLPTHRELSVALGVARGTVRRAYAHAERQGLIESRVGRGSFVASATAEDADAPIDLARNHPLQHLDPDLRGVLRELADGPDLARLLSYQARDGIPTQRAAGAAWVARFGLDADPRRVLPAVGGQHALDVALTIALDRGEPLAVGELTYPGLALLAETRGIPLIPVALDDQGLRPDALDAACAAGARAVYCVPSGHVPTAGVLGADRRAAMVDVIRRRGVALVEDDVHGLYDPQTLSPLSAGLPDQAYFVAAMSKAVAAGLRVAYLAVPEAQVEAAERALSSSVWFPPPLMTEIARRWIEDGTADAVAARKRAEAARRLALARERLAGLDYRAHPGGLFAWLAAPPGVSGEAFALEAQRRGVRVTPSAAFVVGDAPPPARVRVCLGSPSSLARLDEGLRRLVAAHAGAAGPRPVVV